MPKVNKMTDEEFSIFLLEHENASSFYFSCALKNDAKKVLELLEKDIENWHYQEFPERKSQPNTFYLVYSKSLCSYFSITEGNRRIIFAMYKNPMIPLFVHDAIKFLTKCQRFTKKEK